jgi:cardiolipin synthase
MKTPLAAPLLLTLLLILASCAAHQRFIVPEVQVGQPQFNRIIEAHTLSGLVGGNDVQLLLNGEQIFPAMLGAIRGAHQTITFANYLYEKGAIAEEMAEAFAERCRAGVKVHILLDASGSNKMPKRLREAMREAGCQVEMFHPLSVFTIRHVNHRNHRRILVADGRVGFVGGTGVGDPWMGDGRTPHHWRQTDVRVKGPVVRAIQAAFAEPWRETTGVLLGGDAYFPDLPPAGSLNIQSVKSSPIGGAAEAYLLFLLAFDGARSSIMVTNPYFVPDGLMMEALERAVQRGVQVQVLMAGEADTMLDRIVRKASQASFGRALSAGIRIHEYRGALLHAKTITIDGKWSTVGSANLDRRSFALNQELNIASDDPGLARQLERIYAEDLKYAHEVMLEQWRSRGLGRLFELFVLPLQDQL